MSAGPSSASAARSTPAALNRPQGSGEDIEHEIDVHVDQDVEGAADACQVPAIDEVVNWVLRVLRAERTPPVSVSVRVVGESVMRELNALYRQRDRSTNVLSFPADVPAPLPVRPLGDLVVCAPVVVREAADAAMPAADRYAHMLVHGTLHLLGYDHESDEQATVMEALETRLLTAAGLADPYH